MKRAFPKRFLAVFIVAVLAASGSAARADLLNGSFANGLANWNTTNDPSDPVAVTVSNGIATIPEDQTANAPIAVQLWQDFSIPSGAQSLVFQIVGLGTDPFESSYLDAFGNLQLNLQQPFFAVDLLKLPNTQDTLIQDPNYSIAGSTDYYTRQLYLPVSPLDDLALSGVMVTPTPPSDTSAPIMVTLSLPSGLTGMAELLFSVFPNNDPNQTSASISITGVTISTGTGSPSGGGVAPEPSSLVLCGVAAVVLAGRRWRSRCRKTVAA